MSDIEPFIRKNGSVRISVGGNGVGLELHNKHERFYASSAILDLIYVQGDIDALLARRLTCTGDRVLDGGANIGYTAALFLEAGAAQIVAVEPVKELYQRLSASAGARVEPVWAALAREAGEAILHLSTTHNQGSSLSEVTVARFPDVFGGDHEVATVPVTTIDALVLSSGPFDVWKLDIEGAEVSALYGATKALSTAPPRIIIAELFDDIALEFRGRISSTHPCQYRAFVTSRGYELALVPADTAPSSRFRSGAPMYVFAREPI